MAEEFQDKTEEATPKKLSDARKKGQVAKSQDLTAGILLFSGMMFLFFFSSFLFGGIKDLTIGLLRHLYEPFTNMETLIFWAREGIKHVMLLLSPVLLGIFLAAFFANLFQIGFLFSTEPIVPKWKNINIFDAKNYKKFFSITPVMRLVFGMGKMTAIAVVAYITILVSVPDISNLMKANTAEIILLTARLIMIIGLATSLILIVLGVADFAYQKWKYQQDMKMTKQELKDERRQTEGDMHVKGKMRSMMQSFTQSRMKQNVPHADVIVANPVHFAIAIKYDGQKMPAPMCVAKGARRIALDIKKIAAEHGIPIVENPPLARALFKAVEVGMYVPPNFYHAVAEVLAYVYGLNEKMKTIGQRAVEPQLSPTQENADSQEPLTTHQ